MFAQPQALWLLLLLPLLFLPELWRERRRRRALDSLSADRRGLGRLLRTSRPARRLLPFALQLLAFLLAVGALARPQWGEVSVARFSSGRQLYIALDLSRSMWAEDVGPNRLERAKLLARDTVKDLPEEQIGLISFAGSAEVQVPLTSDPRALLDAIAQLSPATVGVGGTNLARVLETVHEDLAESGNPDALVLLLTDGEDLEDDFEEAVASLDLADVPVLAVGIGTSAGGPIPDHENPGEFIRDPGGRLVHSRLENASLRRIARLTGGEYRSLEQADNVPAWVRDRLGQLDSREKLHEHGRMPRERYLWLLLPALLLMLAAEVLRSSWRPSVPAATTTTAAFLALLAGLGPTPAPAVSLVPSSQRPDDPGRFIGLEESRRQAALNGWEEGREEAWDSSLRQLGDALLSEDPSLQRDSHRRLGHILYQRGLVRFEEELAALDGVSTDAGADSLASPERRPRHLEAMTDFPWEQIRAGWEDALVHLDDALALRHDEELAAERQVVADALDRLDRLQEESERARHEQRERENPVEPPLPGQTGESHEAQAGSRDSIESPTQAAETEEERPSANDSGEEEDGGESSGGDNETSNGDDEAPGSDDETSGGGDVSDGEDGTTEETEAGAEDSSAEQEVSDGSDAEPSEESPTNPTEFDRSATAEAEPGGELDSTAPAAGNAAIEPGPPSAASRRLDEAVRAEEFRQLLRSFADEVTNPLETETARPPRSGRDW